MDTTFGAELIVNTWEQIKIDEPFSNNLRSDLIRNVKPYYRNSSVQSILERIERTNMSKIDSQRVQELRDKYEFIKSQNQPEAWKKLILRSIIQENKDLYIGNQIWIKNIKILKEVFETVDIKVPLELAQIEKDIKIKYWLTYSCCYLENSNYPNKSDERLVKRIHNLISEVEIERANSKNVTTYEIDYLNQEYQTFKQWHN